MKIQFLLSWMLALTLGAALRGAPPPPMDNATSFAAAAKSLGELVGAFVENDEIVGAELLVLHRGRPLLNESYGYADREAKRPLEPGNYFAVRSMTKPFTGMAAQRLIELGKLDLDTPVARYLPSFATGRSGKITVRQLLTHRAGFPFIAPAGKPLHEVKGGLRELADEAGARGPEHEPGTKFVYSDVGSDVVGALVAAVAGMPLEDFLRAEILGPLGLRDIFPEAEAVAPPRREQVPARYLGIAGYWTRYWDASRPPLYPFLKGSGGLYATTTDYARFLQAWMGGQAGAGETGLSKGTIERALTPVSRAVFSTGFANAMVDYGEMWMLYRRTDGDGGVFGFGHGGSDGTHAYAFPGSQLVVCYFTQSRGNDTGARFEAALDHLFLRPDPAAMAQLLSPRKAAGLAEFEGIYAPGNQAMQAGAICELDGALVFEIPGRMVMRLQPTQEPDRWTPQRAPNDAIVFQREGARVGGLTLHRGANATSAPRFRPDPSLPTPEELMAVRRRAVPPDRVAALWPLRIRAEIETAGGKVAMTSIYAEDRAFTEIDLGAAGAMRIWVSGDRVWRQMGNDAPVVELQGVERAEYWTGSLLAEVGEWTRQYAHVAVLSRETLAGEDVFRVYVRPRGGFASIRFVSAQTGLVVREVGTTIAAGGGPQNTETAYGNFRDCEGVQIAGEHHLAIRAHGVQVKTRIVAVEPRATVERQLLAPPNR